MSKYISCGKYNKINKYICFYVILNLIYEYLFGNHFQEDIGLLNKINLPKSILIQDGFNYLFIFIFSIIFYKRFKYESSKEEKEKEKNKLKQEDSNSNKEYLHDYYKDNISKKILLFIIFLLILSD